MSAEPNTKRCRRIWRWSGASTIVVALVTCISLFVGTSASFASGGTGAGDPTNSGCYRTEVGVRVVHMIDYHNGHDIGWAYLRYSTACQTEWVTVNYNSGYIPSPSVWVQNTSGTDLYTSDFAPWQGTVWTWQLGGMKYRAACGGVQVYYTNGIGNFGAYEGWYYLGCA